MKKTEKLFVNKEILFLYENISHKNTLLLCEEVIKSVLRKFRKSASITYRQIDFSESCREKIKKILKNDVSRCDGVLYYSDKNAEETEFFNDCFNVYTVQYLSGNHSIISPAVSTEVKKVDDAITKTISTKAGDIEKAVSLALNFSKERSKRIIICTDSKDVSDRLFCKEVENHLANTREYEITHFEFDELIYTFTKRIPALDAILCPPDKASCIKMHINSLNKFPLSYNILHAEACRIYKRDIFPYEEFSNLSYASLLISAENLLEKELGFKSAGMHLKKAVRLAVEKCYSESIDEFQAEVIRNINTPIRNRQVKTNDSDN